MVLDDQPTGCVPIINTDHGSQADDTLDRHVQHEHPWWRKPHPVWVLVIMFIFAFNLNVTSPVRPGILIDLACIVRNVPVGEVAPPTTALPEPPRVTPWQVSVSLMRAAIPAADMTILSNTPSPFPGIDPATCKRDVGVQKLTAQIQMGITIVSGILSILVVGPWTSRSDRVGRKPVLAGVALGIFLNEALFLGIVLWPEVLRHTGISIFFAGSFIEGILGAAPVLSAVSSAYITDTATATSRFAYFAAVNGFLMAGAMVGPLLGSFLIRLTKHTLVPFKVSLVGHTIIIALLLVAVPESLSDTARQLHQTKHDAVQHSIQRRRAAERAQEDVGSDIGHGGRSWLGSRQARFGHRVSGMVRRSLRRIVQPFASMRIFAPRMRSASQRRQGRDWNLALVGIATFVVSMTSGISNPKTQYVIYAFGWGEGQLALLYTLSSACRFTALMAIAPLLSRYIRPRFLQNLSRRTDEGPFRQEPDVTYPSEQEPLLAADLSPPSSDDTVPVTPSGSVGGVAFDKALISACFGIEVISYLAIGVNVKASGTLYIVSAAFHSLAAPANPATASLALQVAGPDIDTGLLFGALGIVDGLSSVFLAPILFTSVFTATISWFPSAMFIVAAACWSVAFVSIVLVSNPFTVRSHLA